MAEARSPSRFDLVTILAIGMVAYLVKNVVHEAVGHGGACMLVGGKPLGLSSAWWDGSYDGVSEWARRGVRAAGTLANLALGFTLAAAWKWVAGRASAHTRVVVWLVMVTNLFAGAGYMLSDPIGGFGDWSRFAAGLEARGPILVGLVLVGALISAWTVRFAARSVDGLLGTELHERRSRLRALCLGPYLVGGVTFTLAGLLNPYGAGFAVTSALATFGGTAFLAWLPAWIRRWPARTNETIDVPRSWGWVAAGIGSAIIVVAVLGPGIAFSSL